MEALLTRSPLLTGSPLLTRWSKISFRELPSPPLGTTVLQMETAIQLFFHLSALFGPYSWLCPQQWQEPTGHPDRMGLFCPGAYGPQLQDLLYQKIPALPPVLSVLEKDSFWTRPWTHQARLLEKRHATHVNLHLHDGSCHESHGSQEHPNCHLPQGAGGTSKTGTPNQPHRSERMANPQREHRLPSPLTKPTPTPNTQTPSFVSSSRPRLRRINAHSFSLAFEHFISGNYSSGILWLRVKISITYKGVVFRGFFRLP